MPNLVLGTNFEFSLKNKVKFADLSEDLIIDKIIKDGRVMGLIFERLIENLFDNVRYISGNKDYDLIIDEELKVECKVGNTNFDISRSCMRGQGRKFDAQLHLKWLHTIDGFILGHLSNAPIIRVYAINHMDYMNNSSYFDKKGQITSKISINKAKDLTRDIGFIDWRE